MSEVEFEPTLSVLKREKTVHTLDLEATVIGKDDISYLYFPWNSSTYRSLKYLFPSAKL
jgi:hypothetical protein